MNISGVWIWHAAQQQFTLSPACAQWLQIAPDQPCTPEQLQARLGTELVRQWMTLISQSGADGFDTTLIPSGISLQGQLRLIGGCLQHGQLCGSLEWLETPTAERCFSDHLPLGMIELDSQTIYHLNQTLRGWLQLRNVPPLPQRWEAVFPPALLRELGPLMQAVAAGSREQRLTWKERTLQLEAASDLTADGHKLMIVHDISRYQAAVQAMQHTEERWRRALEVSGDGVWDWYPQAGVEYLSDRLLAIYGYDRADLESDPEELDRRTHPDDLAEMRAAREAHFSGQTPMYINEHRVQSKDGSWKWVLTRGMVLERDAEGKPLRVVGTHTDISERKRSEAALREGEERLRMALSATHQGTYDLDLRFGTAVVSAEYARMLGYDHAHFVENRENWIERLHPGDFRNSERAFRHYVSGKAPEYRAEFRQRHAEGHWVWIMSVGAVVEWDTDGNPLRMLGTVTDITERKQAEALIWQQAHFDTLTSLPNRRMLYDQLEKILAHRKQRRNRFAVLFIDLDYFKEVNDTLSHAAGDRLLQEAAARLAACVSRKDMVARLGGDEFMVILRSLADPQRTEQIAAAMIASISAPFQIGGETIFLSASIGITRFPEDAQTVNDLIKQADQAMYAAKAAGRNRYSFFTPSLQTAALARMRLSNDLRFALQEQQLHVVYQPVVALATGKAVKAEALIRWQHPQKGWISPLEFIPLAESSGQITAIGDFVFDQALQQVAQWRQSLDPEFQISINQSPVEFQSDPSRYQRWLEAMEAQQLPGQSITIEITEGLLLDASEKVVQRLLEFSAAGVQVAIDDFGTGYSSLSYLKKFDIDFLKIDQSFVRNLQRNNSDHALCEAIIMMAHKLGLKVIAEGVETTAQADLLREAGCDFAQGYLYGKPSAAADFLSLPCCACAP